MIYDLLNPYKKKYEIIIVDYPAEFSIEVRYGNNILYKRGKGGLCRSGKIRTMNVITAEVIAKIKKHEQLLLTTKNN